MQLKGKWKHGQKRKGKETAEYRIWCHMHSRCGNTKLAAYPLYGGRGIKVCSRWDSFLAFYEDMGPRPGVGYSLDRINCDGDYEPANCRWASSSQQQRNRRNNREFTFQGVTAPLSELCEMFGCKYKTVHARIQKGAPIELAMTKGTLPRGRGNALQVTLQRLLQN